MLKRSLFFGVAVLAGLSFASCSKYVRAPSLPETVQKEERITFGRLSVQLFSEEASEESRIILDVGGEKPLMLKNSPNGAFLIAHPKEVKPKIVGLFIDKRETGVRIPLTIPLGNRYYKDEDKNVACFGDLKIRVVLHQQGEAEEVPAISHENETARLPAGVTLDGHLSCAAALKDILEVAPEGLKISLEARLPAHWRIVDPLYVEYTPDKTIVLSKDIYPAETLRPYSLVRVALKSGDAFIASILMADGKQTAFLHGEQGEVTYVPLEKIASISAGLTGEKIGDENDPRELSEEEIEAFISGQKCAEDKTFKPGPTIKPRPSLRHSVAHCEDESSVGDFYFKVKTQKGNLWQKCSSGLECKGDECSSGRCVRKCEDVSDCGGEETLCLDGLCYLKCEQTEDCPKGMGCEADSYGKMCLPAIQMPEKTIPVTPRIKSAPKK